jgi:peptidyl-tRNA hydrolase, PTH1 family
MFYIVGLGNPGASYKKTRHNAGWWVLDALISAWELPSPRLLKKYDGEVSEGMVAGEPVTLLYPQTFMNNSGAAVRKLVPKGASEQLILVYDDVDLPCGQVRVSFGNGAGGHNGVKSVIETLGTKDFIRVRVGVAAVGEETGHAIRPSGDELAAYVLAKITPAETAIFTQLMPLLAEIVGTIITDGKEKAMNRWN